MTAPRRGSPWCWPDGRRTVLSTEDIARGYVVAQVNRNTQVIHYIADGRYDTRRDILDAFTVEQMRRGEIVWPCGGEG